MASAADQTALLNNIEDASAVRMAALREERDHIRKERKRVLMGIRKVNKRNKQVARKTKGLTSSELLAAAARLSKSS